MTTRLETSSRASHAQQSTVPKQRGTKRWRLFVATVFAISLLMEVWFSLCVGHAAPSALSNPNSMTDGENKLLDLGISQLFYDADEDKPGSLKITAIPVGVASHEGLAQNDLISAINGRTWNNKAQAVTLLGACLGNRANGMCFNVRTRSGWFLDRGGLQGGWL